MKNQFLLISILFLSFIFLSCSSNKPCDCTSLTGDYTFFITDSVGTKLLEGKVYFNEITKGNYSVKSHIDKEYKDFPWLDGFRSQNQRVSFNETSRKVYISTGTVESDYSIYLDLDLVGNSLVGEWTHSTMQGVVNKGRFTGSSQE